jgi:hypothetical protein
MRHALVGVEGCPFQLMDDSWNSRLFFDGDAIVNQSTVVVNKPVDKA